MSKDYYKILGIERSSSADEIKKAYRKIAHKYHPDKKTGDSSKFKEANEAYSVLSDKKKRSEYDSYGRVFSDGGGNPFNGGGAGFGGFDFSGFAQGGQGVEFDLGDIFGDIFGGRGGSRGKDPRGRDISMDVEISFKDSVFGVSRKILLNKIHVCDECKGDGGEKGSLQKKCESCNGNGRIQEVKRSILGSFASERVCDTCVGTGKVPEKKCKKCAGARVIKGQQEITVAIPAGINHGEMIRLTGGGEAVAGGNSGDLYIKIHVENNKDYTKVGNDLHTDLHIKISDALLGSVYTLQTFDGGVELKVPQGVVHNELLRIKGKGVVLDTGKRGNILVRILIDVPQKLSKKAKKLVEELKEEGV
jgi:molecular chaperone DnaJ